MTRNFSNSSALADTSASVIRVVSRSVWNKCGSLQLDSRLWRYAANALIYLIVRFRCDQSIRDWELCKIECSDLERVANLTNLIGDLDSLKISQNLTATLLRESQSILATIRVLAQQTEIPESLSLWIFAGAAIVGMMGRRVNAIGRVRVLWFEGMLLSACCRWEFVCGLGWAWPQLFESCKDGTVMALARLSAFSRPNGTQFDSMWLWMLGKIFNETDSPLDLPQLTAKLSIVIHSALRCDEFECACRVKLVCTFVASTPSLWQLLSKEIWNILEQQCQDPVVECLAIQSIWWFISASIVRLSDDEEMSALLTAIVQRLHFLFNSTDSNARRDVIASVLSSIRHQTDLPQNIREQSHLPLPDPHSLLRHPIVPVV
eukprot:c7185_g1_i1.p1 GENE.c7185_g1_i1~~c7185_g1_i1.p1  ORF type:complete len:376 (-),score=69.27 c7185_g1_i1:282-1409(-)